MAGFVYLLNTNGETVDLETHAKLVAHDGWGMAPLHPLVERGPMQNGVTYRDYRLDPRVGTLVFRANETALSDLYSLRSLLAEFLTPASWPLKLRFVVNGSNRQIDCYYSGELSGAWTVNDWAAQRMAINFICPDPTFYDPTPVSVYFDIGAGDSGEIPSIVPMLVGSTDLNASIGISYLGTADTYPVINVTGPVTDFVLTNDQTGDKLDFTGVTIAGGDTYTIDCGFGAKSVVDGTGTNKIADLTDDSDLASFVIPAPGYTLAVPVASYTATGSGVTAATQIEFIYYSRYIGI